MNARCLCPQAYALSESQSKAASELETADLCVAGLQFGGAPGVPDEHADTVVRLDHVVEVHAGVAAGRVSFLALACDGDGLCTGGNGRRHDVLRESDERGAAEDRRLEVLTDRLRPDEQQVRAEFAVF